MPRNTDRPLTAKEQKFIRFYSKPGVRDIEKAAQLAGMPGRDGKTLYKRPEVRGEIDRRLRLVELEQAKLDAEAEVLSNDIIDKALAATMALDAKEFGSTKLAAIQLALVVKGRIETRNAKSVQTQSAPSAFRPSIYGSISAPTAAAALPVATTTTTTLRRTEEVIQTQGETPAPAICAPKLPVFEFEVIER